MTQTKNTRTERDTMGEMQVPEGAYYGATTQRAVLNFPISTLRYPDEFIHIHALIKQAAAKVNMDLGLLDKEIGQAIIEAAGEVIQGRFDSHFPIDLFQTGSGTSTNTNVNEVVARRTRELMPLGDKRPHPNDHVNMGQSSNDTIPTSSHLTAAKALKEQLVPALEQAEATLRGKAEELWEVVKTGRTHLQDATPIRMGQEFQGYADQMLLSRRRLQDQVEALGEVALGGTAVGTGVNAHPDFARSVCAILTQELGLNVRETPHHFQAQGSQDALLAASGAVRTVAVSLQKIANDIRWLSSGPRAGLGELELPAVQPGSSIMPGKINPVIAESLLQVVCQVIGNDATVSAAAQGGYLELNTYWPVAAYNLHQSITLLAAATKNFEEQCLRGLKATSAGPDMLERGLMLATGLTPAIGYDAATAVAKEAATTGRTLRELAKEKHGLTDEQLNVLLDPVRMTKPGIVEGAGGGS